MATWSSRSRSRRKPPWLGSHTQPLSLSCPRATSSKSPLSITRPDLAASSPPPPTRWPTVRRERCSVQATDGSQSAERRPIPSHRSQSRPQAMACKPPLSLWRTARRPQWHLAGKLALLRTRHSPSCLRRMVAKLAHLPCSSPCTVRPINCTARPRVRHLVRTRDLPELLRL